MISICLFGAGRIGSVHASNINANPRTTLKYVVDVDTSVASRLAVECGATVVDVGTALADPTIDAVLIASATATHAELIEESAKARKAIFCEKPLDLDLGRVKNVSTSYSKLMFHLDWDSIGDLTGISRQFMHR